ncbi:MAG: GNAT family N-acetyltransferase [Euryarchaeota archaeon]|nr:GNAT family N-acetyltransferase [Euryarchaeota archaeon]
MTIRKGEKKDLAQVPEILMDSYRGLEEYGEESIEKARRYIEDLYDEDPECFFVAEVDGKIAGFIFCNRFWYSKFEHSKVGAIHEIVVLPGFRHAGIGKELIEKAMEFLGPGKIELWVGEHNTKAIEFYKKLGFEEREKAGKWVRMIKN